MHPERHLGDLRVSLEIAVEHVVIDAVLGEQVADLIEPTVVEQDRVADQQVVDGEPVLQSLHTLLEG